MLLLSQIFCRDTLLIADNPDKHLSAGNTLRRIEGSFSTESESENNHTALGERKAG